MLSLKRLLQRKIGTLQDLTMANASADQRTVDAQFENALKIVADMNEVEGNVITAPDPWKFEVKTGTCFGGKFVVTGQIGDKPVYRAHQKLFDIGGRELSHEVVIKVAFLTPNLKDHEIAYILEYQHRAIEVIGVLANCSGHSLEMIDGGHLQTPDGKIVLVWQAFEAMKGSVKDLFETLSPEEKPFLIVRLLEQMSAVLSIYHARGIVHRDIKPGNVLYDSPDEQWLRVQEVHFKLADTGLVSIAHGISVTQSGTTPGTPVYMSPEQIKGEAIDTSDIWSLGVMLYEMATGQLPHARSESIRKSGNSATLQTLAECMTEIVNEKPRLLSQHEARARYPQCLVETVDQMLETDAGRRPTAVELRRKIMKGGCNVPIDFLPPVPPYLQPTVSVPIV